METKKKQLPSLYEQKSVLLYWIKGSFTFDFWVLGIFWCSSDIILIENKFYYKTNKLFRHNISQILRYKDIYWYKF